MAGSNRYSEADRRGRNSNQDVTNIGVAGRRTGLRVEGARRGSDGFENESAFFSPTTTAKKPSSKDLSSAKSVQSATRNSASYQDMDLEASSAQDVATTLRRRSEGPKSPSRPNARRSRSPTKTHLNSPALRVRSTSRHPASPPKSALRDPSRPTISSNAKVARKLDFNRVDSGADSEDNLAEATVNASAKKSARSTRTSLVAADVNDDDEMAEADVTIGSTQDENYAGQAGDQPDDDAAQDNAVDEDPPFNEYINDQEDEPQVEAGGDDEPEPIDRPTTSKGSKRNQETTEAARQDDEDVQATDAITSDVENNGSAPEDDNAVEPQPRKRGRPKKSAGGPAKKIAKKDKVAPRPSFSPTRASRERSTRTASPQRKWREPINHEEVTRTEGEEDDGVRKSSRFKIAPLAFWRGEKVVYGRGSRRKSIGGTMGLTLPEVKEIIHVDLIEGESKKRSSSTRADVNSKQKRRRRRRRIKAEEEEEEEEGSSSDGEGSDAWEESITVEAPVRSFESHDKLVKKVLAIPENAYEPRAVVGQGIFFQKTLSEEPHFAAGVLDIPTGQGKPVKPSKQNTMFFFIFTGYVQVKIHDVVFRLRRGGQFTVPRGNFYEILNVGKKDARLFFSQSTDTLANHLLAHPEQQQQQQQKS